MSDFSLDTMRQRAKAYTGMTVDGVRLRSPLHLSAEDRDSIKSLHEGLKEALETGGIDEAAPILEAILKTVAEDAKAFGRLLKKVDEVERPTVLFALFQAYGESTQVGEASA